MKKLRFKLCLNEKETQGNIKQFYKKFSDTLERIWIAGEAKIDQLCSRISLSPRGRNGNASQLSQKELESYLKSGGSKVWVSKVGQQRDANVMLLRWKGRAGQEGGGGGVGEWRKFGLY